MVLSHPPLLYPLGSLTKSPPPSQGGSVSAPSPSTPCSLPSLSQGNSHGGSSCLEGAAPLHWRTPQEWGSVKKDCRAQGRGWGWRAERLTAAPPLEEVSWGGRWRGGVDGKLLCITPVLTAPPSLPPSADAPFYLLVGMGRGWDLFTSPDRGASRGGGVPGGVPEARYRSSGELLRWSGDRPSSMTSEEEEEQLFLCPGPGDRSQGDPDLLHPSVGCPSEFIRPLLDPP